MQSDSSLTSLISLYGINVNGVPAGVGVKTGVAVQNRVPDLNTAVPPYQTITISSLNTITSVEVCRQINSATTSFFISKVSVTLSDSNTLYVHN